ncbi:MAG: hypothetical protein NOI47_000397 [Candidatus Phytoplasma pruni]|nr:hypothetical protein [Candidatus Phytoplasma pruni]
MKRYDINVLDRKDIPNVLKYFNLQCGGFYDPNIPSYNAYRQTTLYYYLKNPPSGLLGVYFKPRLNPFKIEYPYADNNYTLEDLLKYEIAIEEAFVFWDVKQKPQDENVNIKLIVSDIFADQNKEEIINRWLINNNIIKQPKLIKLGCYNATPNTGLVAPLPSRTFHEIDIDAVYFDDGIRIMEPHQGNIDVLLKLSNGAKNIYLFTFNIGKRVTTINLPDSLHPYEAIQVWKRANNLSAYEGEYKKHSEKINNPINIISPASKTIDIFVNANIITNIFETEDKIYRIGCKDIQPKENILVTYQNDLGRWLDQCYIKYGCTYQAETIRNKLGRSSKTLYDENGNVHWYSYVTGVFLDDWYIDGNDCASGGDRWQTRTYYQFLDSTPPPKKPAILDSIVDCTTSNFKAAGFMASELKAAGYTASDLKDCGYEAQELKAGGYTFINLVNAGHSFT